MKELTQRLSSQKVKADKVSTKNLLQLVAHKTISEQILPKITVPFPKPERPGLALDGTKVFGISLDSLQARDSASVPLFLQSLIRWIEENALKKEGVFRISTESSQLANHRERIDVGDYTFDKMTVEDACGLLKV